MSDIVKDPSAFYFGTVDMPGHYFWSTEGYSVYKSRGDSIHIPWDRVDGVLTPHNNTEQGHCIYRRREGWTALAIHDYTVDHRRGSNSVFFIQGNYDSLDNIVAALRVYPFFAAILDRIGELTLEEN